MKYFWETLQFKISVIAFLIISLLIFRGCGLAHAETSTQLDCLVLKIIQAESSGNPNAIGENGERGLMQIEKSTWMEYSDYGWNEAFDPAKNVQVGRHILEDINEVYTQSKCVSIARIVYTYNTGIFCFRKHLPRWTKNHPNRIYREIFRHES